MDLDELQVGDKFANIHTGAVYTYVGRNYFGQLKMKLQDVVEDYDDGIRDIGIAYWQAYYVPYKDGDEIERRTIGTTKLKMVDEQLYDFGE